MQFRLFKLRFRRRIRHGQKQVEDLGQHAEAGLEQHFFKRLSKLGNVWRFMAAWVGLLVIISGVLIFQLEDLSNHYQTLQPVPGGTYTEGLTGTFSNANPLYATSEVDTTVSHLVFAGLLTYNTHNQLTGSLASRWSVNELGNVYTVYLKPHLTWQDGQPLTADDVVFTYQAIQNPDAQSPLAPGWQGIKVEKKNASTVTFTLPNPLASFPYGLTNGIIPAHIFQKLAVSDWRSADFNSVHPIGAGPFAWSALQVVSTGLAKTQVLIALQPFKNYVGGTPKLSSFVVHVFNDENEMIKSFRQHQLSAVTLPNPPSSFTNDKSVHLHSFLVTGATMVFFNTGSGVFTDAQVRHALVDGTDTTAIIKQLGFTTRAVREPLLIGQLGYNSAYAQANYDPIAAKAALDKAGWVLNDHGVRTKNGQTLQINLVTPQTDEYQQVSKLLARDWQAIGVKTALRAENAQDFQNTLNARSYDAVLDSIAIGVDPDVFVYWDSSQTDPRSSNLNLSGYKSSVVDAALEAGRTRLDPSLRVIKYKPFLQTWQQDAPALGLYQPHYLYLTHTKVYGLDAGTINTGTDRFNNVQNWMIRVAKTTSKV